MGAFYLCLALILLGTMLAGLMRVMLGPEPADRMLGLQLFGSTSVGVLLLLGQAAEQDGLYNIALVFLLLALMAVIAFVERMPPEPDKEEPS